ncbi:MAG: hypothetical protein U5K32_12605 [Bacteroidales bacterium]|nr:hypothetical protein [Bacteroidales bacterium]
MPPNPDPANWVDFIPETDFVLTPSTGAGYFFAHYMVDAISKVEQYDTGGKMIREIKLPGIGTASGFSAKKEDKELYFSFTNYITPATIYKLDPESGEREVYKKPDIDFNSDDYMSEQVFYKSKDGTEIPMIISI